MKTIQFFKTITLALCICISQIAIADCTSATNVGDGSTHAGSSGSDDTFCSGSTGGSWFKIAGNCYSDISFLMTVTSDNLGMTIYVKSPGDPCSALTPIACCPVVTGSCGGNIGIFYSYNPALEYYFQFGSDSEGGSGTLFIDGLGAVGGCTDPDATNYNPSATCLDGTCLYSTDDCMDPLACNYNPSATIDDGSCTYPGCDDPTACNYDADAGCDDGSCTYYGCTDPDACNYDPSADCDDGSCVIGNSIHLSLSTDCWGEESSWTITDEFGVIVIGMAAITLDDLTTYEWDLCLEDGCYTFNMYDSFGDGMSGFSSCGANGNYTITDDGGNVLVQMPTPFFGYEANHAFCVPVPNPGCTDVDACNYDPDATEDDGSCNYGSVYHLSIDTDCWGEESSWSITDGGGAILYSIAPVTLDDQTNYTWDVCLDDGCYTFNMYDSYGDGMYGFLGCGTNGNYTLTDDLGNVLVQMTVVNFGFEANHSFCVPVGTLGCTNSTACNYDPDATTDDGSCILPDGCTNPTACNYDATALCDDGSCILPDGCTNPTACNYDATALCDDDSCILPDGCTNPTACNYDATALCDDSSCILPDGCTDITSCNYDAGALCDDGSCIPDGTETFYADDDGDGYGDAGDSQVACTQPPGYVTNDDDCDDTNEDIHPGATEICGNAMDDDCSGGDLLCGDHCSNAIALTVGLSCSPLNFSNVGATNSTGAPATTCGGTPANDMWFQLVMPASGHLQIEVENVVSFNTCYTVYSGTCGSLTQLACAQLQSNRTFHDESLVGQTIYVRVWEFASTSGGTFSICAWEPDTPDNDFCAEAFSLAVGTSCSFATYTSIGTTAESTSIAPNPTCGFYQGGDVWFTLEVPLSGHLRIEVENLVGINAQFALYTGTCGAMTQLQCAQLDNSMNIHNHTLGGQTLYLRVWDYNSGYSGGTFELCAWEPDIPENDFCANAIPIDVGIECIMETFSNAYCTAEASSVSPNPTCGFYNGGDVWFTLVMPPTGELQINRTNISGVNAQFALYSGTCGSMTEVACAQLSSTMYVSNLSLAGQTLYLRVYNYNNYEGGTFSICAFDPGCDLILSDVSVTDATCSIAADGSITVTASCSVCTALEYSITNGSSWQSSNVFNGLSSSGTYNVIVRDNPNVACSIMWPANPVTVGNVNAVNTYFSDDDADGYGDAADSQLACTQPTGYVSNDDDCDDTNEDVYPGATEFCNFIDDDCDGTVDEGLDFDGDGYTVCEGDCHDNNININPGATEIPDNPVDEDCDGYILVTLGIPGCTYPFSPNYNPLASVDNGTCICPENTCPADLTGNGIINISDLLIFMAAFGTTCP